MTPVSYKHLCVETIPKRTGNSNPVMLGPVLIHFSKSKAVCRKFLDTLVQKRPALKSLKAFGTDGEVALFEALHESFPEALHLWCFRHFRKNLTEVIRHSGLQAHEDQFVEEVFGSNKTVGLLQAKSTVDFDEHLEDLTRISSSLYQGQIVLPYEALAKEPSKSRLGHCDLDSPQPINCQCEMPHYNYLFMIIFLSPVLLF